MGTLNVEILLSDETHKKFKQYCQQQNIFRNRGYVELLEKSLNTQTIEEWLIANFSEEGIIQENVKNIVKYLTEDQEIKNYIQEIVKIK